MRVRLYHTIFDRENQEGAAGKTSGFACRPISFAVNKLLACLDGVLVGLDHLLDHLTADRTCLAGGQLTVVTLVESYADFACCFHLEFLQCFLCLGNKSLVACNNFISSFIFKSIF